MSIGIYGLDQPSNARIAAMSTRLIGDDFGIMVLDRLAILAATLWISRIGR